ncbi:tryptophan--tRNA ligase [bacterium]
MSDVTAARVVSGMRPTGKLHIGHWQGALINWINLQKKYDCMFFVADWHALTTIYSDTSNLKSYIFEMVCDWLAVGVDPKKSILFVQSEVKQHAEFFLLLSMIVPLGWLERCPTYKEYIQQIKTKESATYGFLGYPVLQTADITAYKASMVPVGEDQVPHLELAREIVRRFHHIYKTDILAEPKAYLTKAPKILGTDGRKMSKSYNNCIYISDNEKDTQKKISRMITDPARIKADDPGHPEVCSIFLLHKILNKDHEVLRQVCKKGEIGCVACKKKIAEILNNELAPIRKKREDIAEDSSFVWDILKEGETKARQMCEKTLDEVHKVMGIDNYK